MGLYWDYTFFKSPELKGIPLGEDYVIYRLIKVQNDIRVINKGEFLDYVARNRYELPFNTDDITNDSYLIEGYFDTYGGSANSHIYFRC